MSKSTRAQSGLDRLMLFVLFVIVVAAVTPFVFELGGLDLRAGTGGTAGPTPSDERAGSGVIVLSTTGETGGFGEDTVGVVRVTVTRNGSGPAIDITEMTANWVGPDGGYTLSTGEGGDGQFGVEVTGPSGSETTLNQSGDRAILTFDLGTDDVEGVDEFSRRLESGDTVTLDLTTARGVTTRVTLDVPDSLGAENSVNL